MQGHEIEKNGAFTGVNWPQVQANKSRNSPGALIFGTRTSKFISLPQVSQRTVNPLSSVPTTARSVPNGNPFLESASEQICFEFFVFLET